jgi:hypothetical protein
MPPSNNYRFLSQPYESALILEDDVNWDIHLRTRQIPLLRRAMHDLFHRTTNDSAQVADVYPPSTPLPGDSYWPMTNKWEILYLGHCGDFFPAKNLQHVEHLTYPDPNLPSFHGLHTDTQKLFAPMPVPSKHRMIHVSQRPLCTFAYAVTRESARRILADFSSEGEDGTVAFDVRILEACRDMGYRCWSVNPELFHHIDDQSSEIKRVMEGPSKTSRVDDETGYTRKEKDPNNHEWDEPENQKKKPSEDDTRRAIARGTPNVGCGIRGIIETLGTGRKVREVVKISTEIDGMCPMPLREVDLLKAEIIEKGRDDLPI